MSARGRRRARRRPGPAALTACAVVAALPIGLHLGDSAVSGVAHKPASLPQPKPARPPAPPTAFRFALQPPGGVAPSHDASDLAVFSVPPPEIEAAPVMTRGEIHLPPLDESGEGAALLRVPEGTEE